MKTIVALLLAWVASTAKAGDFPIDGRTFRVPDGFIVEKVAGPTLVDRPIVADFDELGRLYVADSSGSNEDPKKQLANPTHRIVRLEDTNGDGKYDKSIVFADKMMFPEGAMWRDGSLFVAAPPSIWKLTDTDGDGICDKREEWFKGKTLTGCGNDLHGPYNGPDGWIYWTKGAFAEQTYTLPNGKPFKTRAAHIFRARPDGTGIEPVMTGGMDNPVEIAWSPGGEMFFTTTFLQHPGGGKRDGIIHGVYGGVYGKDHDVLDGHIRTGPDLMPVMTHLGPAAPSGLMRYESSAFGTAYKDNLFCAQFNMHKVSRHILVPSGATFQTIDSDFLTTADNHDFHPTDVLEDADGSILVLDTGGWYKLCCPTSQIGKPEVLGAIYRVKRSESAKIDDPYGLKIDWKTAKPTEVAKHLDDPRTFVRRRSIEVLGHGGPNAAEHLSDLVRDPKVPALRKLNAVWASSRSHESASRSARLIATRDADETVRQAGYHAVSAWLDQQASMTLSNIANLTQPSPQNSRVALELASRLDLDVMELGILRVLANAGTDRVLNHAVTYALIHQESVGKATILDESTDSRWNRIALTVLDQKGLKIEAERLSKALDAKDDTETRSVAEWIGERHPELSDVIIQHLSRGLNRGPYHSLSKGHIDDQFARFARLPAVAEYMSSLVLRDIPEMQRLIVLRAMSESHLKPVPRTWRTALLSELKRQTLHSSRYAVRAVKVLELQDEPEESFTAAMKVLTALAWMKPLDKLRIYSSMPGGPGSLSDQDFGSLTELLSSDATRETRSLTTEVFSRAELSVPQLRKLVDFVKTAGPLELSPLLLAFEKSNDESVGVSLVEALNDSPVLPSLSIDDLQKKFARFPEPVCQKASKLYDRIRQANSEKLAKLDDLAKNLDHGDVLRGQTIFNGTKAACLSCHAIGYVGGQIGPDLSRIGSIRNDRDLLESIVFPNASFVRSYEPMVVATKSGQIHSGVLKKDSAVEVILTSGPDKEVRIPREDVEEMKPGTVSVMPSGLDSQMSKQELADLIAFLKSRK